MVQLLVTLSEDEYEKLVTSCKERGFNSINECILWALQVLLEKFKNCDEICRKNHPGFYTS
ncbi:MAG: hypothetical protein B6V02_02900 [Thermoprotei archaeon ex4572_64]|nr:MAG: hypothetical protein B6V02_02900 [Thermoprotei archaeon ex4572_64]